MDEDKNYKAPDASEEGNQELAVLQEKFNAEVEARQKAEKLAAEKAEALDGTIEELKQLRTKKGPETTIQGNDPVVDIDARVEAALARKRMEEADFNKKAAILRFQNEHQDFHPENDAGGLKFSALLSEFEDFNTSKAYSVDDFVTFLSKAQRLVTPSTGKDSTSVTDDPSTKSAGSTPKAKDSSRLSPKEMEAIKSVGWTEERYLENKKKNPEYIKTLLGL